MNHNYDEDTVIISGDDDVLSRPAEDPAEKAREEAFNAGYSWKGVAFEGLTCSRKDLWIALCFKAGFPPLKAGGEDIQWFQPQAHALIFVCITPSKTLRRLHALGIDAVMDAFTEWVDDNVTIQDANDALRLGERILIQANTTSAEAVPTAGKGGK